MLDVDVPTETHEDVHWKLLPNRNQPFQFINLRPKILSSVLVYMVQEMTVALLEKRQHAFENTM